MVFFSLRPLNTNQTFWSLMMLLTAPKKIIFCVTNYSNLLQVVLAHYDSTNFSWEIQACIQVSSLVGWVRSRTLSFYGRNQVCNADEFHIRRNSYKQDSLGTHFWDHYMIHFKIKMTFSIEQFLLFAEFLFCAFTCWNWPLAYSLYRFLPYHLTHLPSLQTK